MYTFNQKVLFKHCDPAGIVFYPRYFEMINDVVEAFFDDKLNFAFHQILPNNGVPTAQINATFAAPSRMGDELKIDLLVTKLGGSSINLSFTTHCKNELRFSATAVLVFVDKNGSSTSWPNALRKAIEFNMRGDN